MKAVDYLKIKKRFCVECWTCPLDYENNGQKLGCVEFQREHPELAVELVANWAKEHPPKTYLSVLLKKFPNARLNSEGSPRFCREYLYGGESENCLSMSCEECWNQEYKEK